MRKLAVALCCLLLRIAHAGMQPPDPIAQLGFIENHGQVPQTVYAYTPTRAGIDVLTRDGRLIHLLHQDNGQSLQLVEHFSDHALTPRLAEPAPTRVSYFTGQNARDWHRDIPTHYAARLDEVGQGVQIRLVARPGNVEKRFQLAPGADLAGFSVQVDGARTLQVDASGALVAQTASTPIHFTAPVAWQPRSDGGCDPVQVAYTVQGNRYGFRLGPHDHGREVIIDPLLGTALLRDTDSDIRDIATDPSGNVFIVGKSSYELVNLATGYDKTNNSYTTTEIKGYIAKFSRNLDKLLALTFLGGVMDNVNNSHRHAYNYPEALAIDAQGDVFVAGITNTNDFPIIKPTAKTTNALKQSFGGNEFFLARLSNDLNQLVASAYLSGSRNEGFYRPNNSRAVDVALAPDGRTVYLAGTSSSTDLPTNQGSASNVNQPAYRAIKPHPSTPVLGVDPPNDCYLAQLPVDLTSVNATWVGNNLVNGDWGMTCELVGTDGIGSVFVAGIGHGQFETGVTGQTLSQSKNPQAKYSDNGDVMVVRFSADLRTLHNGTFLGTFDGCYDCNTPDSPWDMVITDNAEVVLVGQTPHDTFPTTTGALINQALGIGKNNTVGFVTLLDNSLSIQASTLLHLCPGNTQGSLDCSQGGQGQASAVDYYSYQDASNQTHQDYYVLYRGSTRSTGQTAAYFSLPPKIVDVVGSLHLFRLSGNLSTRIASTDLIFNTNSFHSAGDHLAFSSTYFDGTHNQSDPRLYAGEYGVVGDMILHPHGYTGPTNDPFTGNPISDAGPYVMALSPDLAAGNHPSLAITPTTRIDLGYLPGSTTTHAAAMTVTNNGSTSLKVYNAVFTGNGLGGSWNFNGQNGCLTSNNSFNFPFSLAAGASCKLYIKADTTTAGTAVFRARPLLISNDPNGAVISGPDITVHNTPLLLRYSGNSIQAIDYLNKGLDFGSVSVGSSTHRTITATSRINQLQLGQIKSETTGSPFAIDKDGCSHKILNNNDTCTIIVNYQPTSAGKHEVILDFGNNTNGGRWVALRLHGNAQSATNGNGNGNSGGTGSNGNGSGNSNGNGSSSGSSTNSNSNSNSSSNSGGGLFNLIDTLFLFTFLTLIRHRRANRNADTWVDMF